MSVPVDTPDILRRILDRKAETVAQRREQLGTAAFVERVRSAPAPRGFRQALEARIAAGRPAVIAEVKKASPSKGVLREVFDPEAIGRSYAAGGAACLSVLTEEDFFLGADEHLQVARAASGLPVIRKDFIFDPFQVHEARALGADCVLLIVAALGDAQLAELHALAVKLGMDVLVEVHDVAEMDRALALEAPLIGINNRDLNTFDVSLETTRRLARRVPADRVIVAESGLHTPADLADMARHGVRRFLVGESLMRADDVAAATRALLAGPLVAGGK